VTNPLDRTVGFDLRFGSTGRRICRVRVGAGLLEALVEDLVASPPGDRLFFVSDDRVAPLHAEPLVGRVRARGLLAELLVFPAGEAHKTRESKALLEDRLAALGAGRDAAIVAVGGGVTGDLAGFLAATWHRGVPVVQVPTSLLAMTDAALGGKTAVNVGAFKNVVGAFHQPVAVWADVSVLATQDEQRFREGFAELVKLGVVADARLFSLAERESTRLLGRETEPLCEVVAACMRIKGRIVARDEREQGRRAALNFGHTIGHALEAVSGFAVHHGQAVAIGMCVEGRIAAELTGFPGRHLRRLENVIGTLGLPQSLPGGVAGPALVEATRADKKVRQGRVRYALPSRIGRMAPGEHVTQVVDEARVAAAIARTSGRATIDVGERAG